MHKFIYHLHRYGNGRQSWRLLYRASRDGYSAEEFHKRCDGQSPTFVILMVRHLCINFNNLDAENPKKMSLFGWGWI